MLVFSEFLLLFIGQIIAILAKKYFFHAKNYLKINTLFKDCKQNCSLYWCVFKVLALSLLTFHIVSQFSYESHSCLCFPSESGMRATDGHGNTLYVKTSVFCNIILQEVVTS